MKKLTLPVRLRFFIKTPRKAKDISGAALTGSRSTEEPATAAMHGPTMCYSHWNVP